VCSYVAGRMLYPDIIWTRGAVCLFVFAIFSAPAGHAQGLPGVMALKLTPITHAESPSIHPLPLIEPRKPIIFRAPRVFILTSAAVYGAAVLDMHETISLRPNFVEHDPLARPFVRLPAPAYYAAGLALATGVNWLSRKMARSSRWHGAWWLPQMCEFGGNLWGYTSTKARE
jgi:hypothetical protein